MLKTLHLVPAALLAGLLATGCSTTPGQPDVATYLPDVSDQRSGPLETAKTVEGDAMRLYVGEDFLGPSLIDLFHREVALKAPRLNQRTNLEVTNLEVSILVSGGNFLIDPSRALVGSGRYRPAPGSLVLDEFGPGTRQTVRVEIDYRLDGKPMQEVVEGEVAAATVREQTGELYRNAIDRIVGKLERNG